MFSALILGRAVTHYYTAEQIKWSEGELLTDGINLFQNEGVIDVLFEAICQDVKVGKAENACDNSTMIMLMQIAQSQPSYRFQLLYTKDPQYDFVGSICKTGMFRANRVCMQKAIWLVSQSLTRVDATAPCLRPEEKLQNDPYSGSHRQAAKEKLKREASESRMSKTERNPRAASESARTGKRKLEANERRHNGPERRFADDNDRKTKLIKENQDLEEEIMRLRLIKEQKKLRQELEELQNELDGGGPDRDNDRQDDRECFRGNDSRRGESSRDGGLLLTPPLTISSSTPSRDHLRDREQADRNSWYDNRTA
jgi:hypothetical protein